MGALSPVRQLWGWIGSWLGTVPKALQLSCTVSRAPCTLGRLAPAGAALCPRMVRLWVTCISHVGQPGAGKAQDLENSGAWLEPQKKTTEHSHIYEVAFLQSACAVHRSVLMEQHCILTCWRLPAVFSREVGWKGNSYHDFEWISDGIQLQDVQDLSSGIIGRVQGRDGKG